MYTAIRCICNKTSLRTCTAKHGELIKHSSSKARVRDRNHAETVTERKEKKGVLDVGLGQKRTTLTRSGEGVEMSDFISFPILQLFLSEQSSSARTGGREAQGGVHKPSNAYEKLVTLISLRALQLCHGIILAVTLIDWCQRPPILSKRAIMSFNAWLLIDML